MGCSMVPMMFPGIQQYVPPMGMAMGMGMGMEMGMSRPMLPFPSVLASSALPSPAAAALMGPKFPVPAFHMPSVPLPSPSNQSDPVLKSLSPQNCNQPRMMNFPGPYHQYLGLHHTQLPLPQVRLKSTFLSSVNWSWNMLILDLKFNHSKENFLCYSQLLPRLLNSWCSFITVVLIIFFAYTSSDPGEFLLWLVRC